ncbi:hypothetical protein KC340_g1021 [Hortaea werneckii]|nr:hypothetical protein KC365_g2613 [Hortaea werneckii]KAI7338295.1 hypothetical protein KC340_g1021 [Hortaea werneckii]KAI7407059.1 hypothetical protein KC328_g681 [Hortaea werneckii]KAI7490863.1 hypothetical protein KC351_g347 [Hortaea werneckii]
MVASQAHHQLEARQGPCDYWGDDSDQCKGFKAYTSSTGNAVQQSSTATAATTTTTASDEDGSDNTDATSISTSLALGVTTATLSGTGISDGKATATNTVVSSDDSSKSIATTSPSTLETSITSNSDATSTGPQTIVGGGLGSDLASPTATSSPTASGLSLQQKQSDGGLSSGAVAAAIVVPLLFALLALILAFLCLRRRRRRRNDLDSTPTSHTHFLAPMREKFSRSSPRNSLPPTASLTTGPPILTSPHNNTYNTGLDTPGTSHRGQSDEYYAVPPRRSEGGTFIDPPPPYKPSSLASSGRSATGTSPSHPQVLHSDRDLLVPPPPTAAAAASHATTPYGDYFHHRRSLGPFTDLAATTTPLADEPDSRPSTAATASTFRAHPLSSAASGSARSYTSTNAHADSVGVGVGVGAGGTAGLSPYDIHTRHGYGPGTTTSGAGGVETRSTTPRSFSSEMYSDTASVHSARAGLVRDGGPRVLGSSGSRPRDGGRGREGDPFGDEGAETEGEEWHSLTGGRGRSGEGSGSGSGRGLGSFEWEEASR